MNKKPINIISFNVPYLENNNSNHRSKKINNKFKKSSTAQYSSKTKQSNPQSKVQFYNPIGINSINNNIYLNLFNKFNTNTASLKQSMISPKDIISKRINNNQMNKIRKNFNLNEMPSSSSIKQKYKSTYIQPDLTNSLNFINNRGQINIRLNLKNQFINDNNTNNNISEYNINYGVDIAEKVKEKNNKIIQLQNDLLKSQEIIYDLNNLKNLNDNSFRFNNLNKSSREKNIFMITKSSESVDKILKTATNEYNFNNLKNKKTKPKTHKNNFLRKSGEDTNKKRINTNEKKKIKNNNIKLSDALYTNHNLKNKKENDYLKLFLPTSNFYNMNSKLKSYSQDRKNAKNKINFQFDNYINNSDKNRKQKLYINNYIKNNIKKIENEFDEFKEKCNNIKLRAKILINNYIDLANQISKF